MASWISSFSTTGNLFLDVTCLYTEEHLKGSYRLTIHMYCNLYSFYADLPPKLSTFLADLSDMFPGGLFDTKYISDYMTRERSSFLAYLFRKYDREDTRMRNEDMPAQLYSTFDIQPRLPLPPLPDTTAPEPVKSGPQVPYCEDYAVSVSNFLTDLSFSLTSASKDGQNLADS